MVEHRSNSYPSWNQQNSPIWEEFQPIFTHCLSDLSKTALKSPPKHHSHFLPPLFKSTKSSHNLLFSFNWTWKVYIYYIKDISLILYKNPHETITIQIIFHCKHLIIPNYQHFSKKTLREFHHPFCFFQSPQTTS